MGVLSLYFVLAMGYELTKIYAEEEGLNMNPLNGAMLSLFAFIMIISQIVFEKGAMTAVTSLKKGAYIVKAVLFIRYLYCRLHFFIPSKLIDI